MKASIERDVGQQIRLWRRHLKLTQGELEVRASLSHNAVSRIEKGMVSPRIETVERLARAMDLSVEELEFRSPPDDKARVSYPTLEELLPRLDELPPGVRENLIRTFHSLVDLVQRER
jgi:transcriptional regulator with XRE-family HTH domain